MSGNVTGRRWNVGDVVYSIMEKFKPPYDNYEIEAIVTKEIIMPKWGRGEEYGYFINIIRSTRNAPDEIITTRVMSGNELRKNPKMGKRLW